MSYFEGQTPSWQHRRQHSWNPQQQQSALHHAQAASMEDRFAFASQYEEILRASDNLAKGGRPMAPHMRSESLPFSGTFVRQYPEIESRIAALPHKYPYHDFDSGRSTNSHPGSTLQGYLAHQRYGSRLSEADQMHQAKRRAAAQRERELRNYHQQQQYNRNAPSTKSDRSTSPVAMSEDDRRDLIARQHRALYGSESKLYSEGDRSPSNSQDVRMLAVVPTTNASPTAPLDRLGFSANASTEGIGVSPPPVPVSQPSRANSATPPASTSIAYSSLDVSSSQQIRATSTSPNNSPSRRPGGPAQGAAIGVAPIGTRPSGTAGTTKRSTPPQPQSTYGPKTSTVAVERSPSVAPKPPTPGNEKSVTLGWNSNNGPWSSNKSGNFGNSVQASVWG